MYYSKVEKNNLQTDYYEFIFIRYKEDVFFMLSFPIIGCVLTTLNIFIKYKIDIISQMWELYDINLLLHLL